MDDENAVGHDNAKDTNPLEGEKSLFVCFLSQMSQIWLRLIFQHKNTEDDSKQTDESFLLVTSTHLEFIKKRLDMPAAKSEQTDGS